MNIHEFIHNNEQEIPKLRAENSLERWQERVTAIFKDIEDQCQGDQMLEDYFEKLVESCYGYTAIVCDFEQVFADERSGKISEEEYLERLKTVDQSRMIVHNATIDSFNILSRLFIQKGKNSDWSKPLLEGGRVAYGNLAIKKTLLDIIEQEKLSSQQHKGDNYGTDEKK